MKGIRKQVWIEAIWVILIASFLGIAVNKFHPKGVKITMIRPPLKYVPDTVLAQDLPIANIEINQEKHIILNVKQVTQLIKSNQALLIDARNESEYQKSHLPGAKNIPFESLYELQEKLNSLPRDKWLICYCDGPSCDLGELLAYELKNFGYKMVSTFPNGMKALSKINNIIDGE